MTRKLIRGRGKQSILVLAGHDVHMFVWIPSMGGDSHGVTLRWRHDGNDWTHLRLVLLQRNKSSEYKFRDRGGHYLVRRTLTLVELARWDTRNGTKDRVGLKSYVRLKASAGGRELA